MTVFRVRVDDSFQNESRLYRAKMQQATVMCPTLAKTLREVLEVEEAYRDEAEVQEAFRDEAAVVPVALIKNRRPYKCGFPACNKTFKNPQTMSMHSKTHCSDESYRRSGANAHMLSVLPAGFKAGHNKKIPSKCPLCMRSFVGLYELRRHYGRKHSDGEKKHACTKCNKKFYIEVDLRDHLKLCGQPILCKCGTKFAFKCNLVQHINSPKRAECRDAFDQSINAGKQTKRKKKKSRQSVGCRDLLAAAAHPQSVPEPAPIVSNVEDDKFEQPAMHAWASLAHDAFEFSSDILLDTKLPQPNCGSASNFAVYDQGQFLF